MARRRRLQLRTFKEKVALRQLVASDAKPLFELIEKNRGHLNKWGDNTSLKYPTYHSVRRSITRPKDPSRIRLGIWHEETLVGSISITADADGGSIEIGYWIDSEFWGEGIATAATETVMHYVFQLREIKRVVGYVHKENAASQKVLTKAGMQLQKGEVKGFYCFALDAVSYRNLNRSHTEG